MEAPIPLEAILGRSVVLHPGSEESQALLHSHRASVTIHELPGTYIGMSDNVGTCRDEGCTAFAYFVSGEFAGLSRPFTIDGTTVLEVWRYEDGNIPHQAVFPDEFVRHGLGVTQFIVADISTATFDLFLARATVDRWGFWRMGPRGIGKAQRIRRRRQLLPDDPALCVPPARKSTRCPELLDAPALSVTQR